MANQTIAGTVIFTRLTPLTDGTRIARVNFRHLAVEDGRSTVSFFTFSSRDQVIGRQIDAGEIALESEVVATVQGETVVTLSPA